MVSNKHINRIGDRLRKSNYYENCEWLIEDRCLVRYQSTFKDLNDLLEWSLCFSSPLYSLGTELEGLPEVREGSVLSSFRLKCLKTICTKAHKLSEGCQLSTLDDIAGIRFIVRDLKHLGLIDKALREYFTKQNIKYKVKNYINENRNTGYHAIHFIVIRDSVRMEIQIRTIWEHIWAQALEAIDEIRNLDFKHNPLDGFFKTTGDYIFSKENGNPNSVLQKQAIELDERRGYTDDLQCFYGDTWDLSDKENITGQGWIVITSSTDGQDYSNKSFKDLEDAQKYYRSRAIMEPETLLVYTDFPSKLSELYVAQSPNSPDIAEDFRQLIYD